MSKLQVKYVGIDNWNRPIFKPISKNSISYYGSTDILFPYGESESEVKKKVTAEDLVFFGTKFNCEPRGFKPNNKLEIVLEV